MRRLWRRFLLFLLGGDPLCPGCHLHVVNCVGLCGKTRHQRRFEFLEGGPSNRPYVAPEGERKSGAIG